MSFTCRCLCLLFGAVVTAPWTFPAPVFGASLDGAPEAICGTPDSGTAAWDTLASAPLLGPGPADCSFDTTRPDPIYEPVDRVVLQVVVHVIQDSTCTDGQVSDATVQSQIDILNEDFLALAGSPGGGGTNAQIEFVLASMDPDGNPTNGITRHCNTTWYNDGGDYWDTLAWDPLQYINVYTNTAANARGYVPFLPSAGNAMIGATSDRVVINWLVFGQDSPFPPHDQGRTATHEVGHFLGLFHPYFAGCGVATPPQCYTTGDTLCDTPQDEFSHDECPVGATSCGGVPVPIENYMELTDDTCMTGFTPEQVQRMRCTLMHYRPTLVTVDQGLFRDGFESGDAGSWDSSVGTNSIIKAHPSRR